MTGPETAHAATGQRQDQPLRSGDVFCDPVADSETGQAASLKVSVGGVEFVAVASMGLRIAARAGDSVLWWLMLIAAIVVASGARVEAMMVMIMVVYPAYEVMFVAVFGKTVGMAVAGIEVVSVRDGSTPTLGQSLGRFVVLTVPLLVPVAGVVTTLVVLIAPLLVLVAGIATSFVMLLVGSRHPLKQGWHDRAAGTVVVIKNR